EGLPCEIASVNEEEHALGLSEFDQSVCGSNGGERLAAAGCHLNEGTGTVILKGCFEIVNGLELGWPESLLFEGRKRMESLTQCGRHRTVTAPLSDPTGECVRFWEAEDSPTSRLWVE